MCSGLEQAADQSDHFVSGSYDIQTSCTATQDNQLSWKLEVIEIVQIQVRSSQTDGRKHGIVLTKISMRRNVHDPAARSMRPQNVFGCSRAHEELCRRQNRLQGFRLIGNRRRLCVRNTQDQRFSRSVRLFLLAQRINARTGSVGNREAIHQIRFAIMQGMERNIVKQAMWNEDQVFGIEQITYWGYQLLIKILEVGLRGLQHRFLECAHVLWIEPKLRELELQQLQQLLHTRLHRYREDAQIVAVENAGEDAVLHAEILHQDGVGGEGCPNLGERNIAGRLQSGVAHLGGSGLLSCAHKIVFPFPRVLL